MKVCSIDGCDEVAVRRRGWCEKHYRRWLKYGDPLGGRSRAEFVADHDEIVRLYTEGLPVAEIARVLGCSVATVCNARRAQGVPYRRRPVLLPDEQQQEIVRLYLSGLSQEQVADEVGTSPSSVKRTLRRKAVELRPLGHPVHGYTGSRTYRSWVSMWSRCTNPNATDYERYGGADPPVRVCERWRKFENFLADMGERPEGTTLGRLADTGSYEPGNCFWQTWTEQRNEAKKKKVRRRARQAGAGGPMRRAN
jgi:DNA-binding CsgD family transcriptional regulator